MKHNYRLLLAFDGTAYQGWQRQKTTEKTIQGTLEGAFGALLGETVKITGSGRTDAGVHAEAMAAHFIAEKAVNPGTFLKDVNSALPEDIRVLEVREMPLSFHSRFDAVGKLYRYQIDTREKAGVFARKYACHYTEPLDVEEMRRAARLLLGEHDFSGFTTDKTKGRDRVRVIYHIEIEKRDGLLTLRFYGSGFLYNMVRILTGTLIEVGTGKKRASDIPAILECRSRAAAGFTAPPQGLFLERVFYEEEI